MGNLGVLQRGITQRRGRHGAGNNMVMGMEYYNGLNGGGAAVVAARITVWDGWQGVGNGMVWGMA